LNDHTHNNLSLAKKRIRIEYKNNQQIFKIKAINPKIINKYLKLKHFRQFHLDRRTS